jgi:hypothetical protein
MYQRKRKPKQIETVLSIGLLMVLTGISAAILFEQYRFNPAVSVPHDYSPAVVKSESKREELIPTASNLTPMTPAEVFKAHNLSDKINGKADLYLSAGFRQLDSRRFQFNDGSESWMEIFVYDMENGLNAFAVFSSQRRDDGRSIELTRFSYQTQNALFFVHGPYYVEMIASKATAPLLAAMILSAKRFIGSKKVKVETIREIGMFPRQHLIENSITLISANAFGYDRLDRVFTADYQLSGKTMTVFISQRKNSVEAEQLARAYHDFLVTYGGKGLQNMTKIKTAKIVNLFDTYELVFSQGAVLAGIHEAPDRAAAEKMADVLNQRLKEVAGGK